MCPACIATVALMVAGATSTGGLTVLVVKKLRAKTGATNVDPKWKELEIQPCSTTKSCPQPSGLLLASNT